MITLRPYGVVCKEFGACPFVPFLTYLRTKGDLDGICKLLHARQHRSTAFYTKHELLCSIMTHLVGIMCLLGQYGGKWLVACRSAQQI